MVKSIGPVTYKLKELDEMPVQGTFYAQELQNVHIDDETVGVADQKSIETTRDSTLRSVERMA